MNPAAVQTLDSVD